MAREPASIRHKNPGAMWPGKIATKWGSKAWAYLNDGTGQGGNGKGNKIATFEQWLDGCSAQLDLWRSSVNYRNKTLAAALKTWSGGNHVEAYIQHVIRKIPDMTRNTVMNEAFWASPNGLLFLKVQAAHEAGKLMPVSDTTWRAAQLRVMETKAKVAASAPKKATVSGSTGTGAAVTAAEGGFPLWAAALIGVAVAVAIFVIWKVKQNKQAATERPAFVGPPVDVDVTATVIPAAPTGV